MMNSFKASQAEAMEVLRSETVKELKHLDSHLHEADHSTKHALSANTDNISKEVEAKIEELQQIVIAA